MGLKFEALINATFPRALPATAAAHGALTTTAGMVFIRGGTFAMGSDHQRPEERFTHIVRAVNVAGKARRVASSVRRQSAHTRRGERQAASGEQQAARRVRGTARGKGLARFHQDAVRPGPAAAVMRTIAIYECTPKQERPCHLDR